MEILHVDDDEDIREIARMSFEMAGDVRVISAVSAAAALNLLSVTKPDAILLDVMMPNMSGPELKSHLDSNPETSTIPVVFMTAATEPEAVRELLDLGAAGVIHKPFDPMELFEAVTHCLTRSS